jgi:ADP-ribosylglycohydrolase
MSFQQGRAGLRDYLRRAGALPLRDYVPMLEGTLVERLGAGSCRGRIDRAEPDDDINYTMLALLVLERRGTGFDVEDVARLWLQMLPAGTTWTAERAAYQTLLAHMDDEFVNGQPPGFDLTRCSDNPYNEWIGGQIRADLYGWVCPGRPDLASQLATRDVSLSHRGEGVYGAAFVAALGAALAVAAHIEDAIDWALEQIPGDSGAAQAIGLGRSLAGKDNAVEELERHFGDLSPVHTLNNLAVVVWAFCSAQGDFSRAVGEAVSAGWDTDCNGATVGGLCGMAGMDVPAHWTTPWQGRIGLGLAGHDEVTLGQVTERTVRIAQNIVGEPDVRH